MEQALLERLKRLAAKSNRPVPPWLEDLLLHGPRFDQWSPMENRPNRVLLTEFVARWLKYAGVSHEEALEWLLDYCMQILIAYSKSGPSAVRHGTKANTRWVYKSDFIFDFEAMASAPVAPAFDQKPPYMPILALWDELQYQAKKTARENYRPPVFVPQLSVKQRHRERFEQGLALAREKKAAGATLVELVELLNAQGLPTRTGRKWSISTLYLALKGKYQFGSGAQTSPPPSQPEPTGTLAQSPGPPSNPENPVPEFETQR